MPWIYFGRDELPAPTLKLPTLVGELVEPADFRGTSALVLFFSHGQACRACLRLHQELAQAAGALRVQGAEGVVVLPGASKAALPATGALPYLMDAAGALRRAYTAIFEFDVSNQAMLFILNQFGAPFRAWVGDEPDHELIPQMLKYLESAALLCPE
jgi:AhpD family alkylhydroperoxidase